MLSRITSSQPAGAGRRWGVAARPRSAGVWTSATMRRATMQWAHICNSGDGTANTRYHATFFARAAAHTVHWRRQPARQAQAAAAPDATEVRCASRGAVTPWHGRGSSMELTHCSGVTLESRIGASLHLRCHPPSRLIAPTLPARPRRTQSGASSSPLPGKRFEVTLRMPIGVVFSQKEGGPVFIESVTPGGNADQAGVQVGGWGRAAVKPRAAARPHCASVVSTPAEGMQARVVMCWGRACSRSGHRQRPWVLEPMACQVGRSCQWDAFTPAAVIRIENINIYMPHMWPPPLEPHLCSPVTSSTAAAPSRSR